MPHKKIFYPETELQSYSAHIEEYPYHDIVIARVNGTKFDIDKASEQYVERYPIADFATRALGDAKFMGQTVVEVREGKGIVNVFELLIARYSLPDGWKVEGDG